MPKGIYIIRGSVNESEPVRRLPLAYPVDHVSLGKSFLRELQNVSILKFSRSHTLAKLGADMSTDLADSISTKSRSHRKDKDRSEKRNGKKRKHRQSEPIESSTKKQKHRKHKSSHLHKSREQPVDSKTTSPFHKQTSSLYLPLAPIAQRHPVQGLRAEHLSPLVLNYYAPFRGVIISYSNPRLSNDGDDPSATDCRQKVFARSYNEYAANFVWLTADFLIFRPERGSVIEGFINLQNESNIGLVCWNFFSASIEQKRLPKDWRWIPGGMSGGKRKKKLKKPASDEMDMYDEAVETVDPVHNLDDVEGHFKDANGKKIEGLVQFRVKSVDVPRTAHRDYSIMSIQGTMLSEQDENDLLRKEQADTLPGILVNGDHEAVDVDSDLITMQINMKN